MVIVSKQLEIPVTGKQLSDYAEGDIVKISENGTPVEFYVAKHDYESSLNGAGRTLVVRKDCYEKMAWNLKKLGNITYAGANEWETASIQKWLNNEYKALLDDTIQQEIGETTIVFTRNGNRDYTMTGDYSVFLLSLRELGISDPEYAEPEGTGLPIYQTLVTMEQWTRTPCKAGGTTRVFWIDATGDDGWGGTDEEHGVRPSFTLPNTTMVNAANVIE